VRRWHGHVITALVAGAAVGFSAQKDAARVWLAGDSHIHSHWSPGYNRAVTPPEPIKGGDARYSTPTNARMARQFGLSWMVTTDHGGPNHAKLNLDHAYPELMESRRLVPDVLQFYGMELNMPGMDHHTLIIPNGQDERTTLFDIESQFDANESWPVEPARNTEAAALRGLAFMARLTRLPILFANHPSRSATGLGGYGLTEPAELRTNHDLAPDVYRGMEGAPGHQAGTLAPDGSVKRGPDGQPAGFRGAYRNPGARTLGGFDQMTAIVGGLWDSLLGEGRRFWIVATSDSHAHYADPSQGGSDFWPGEYQKTYVHANRTYDGVIDGLRSGRIFAVAGDLITELDLTVKSRGRSAEMGGTLRIERGEDVTITAQFRDPESPNRSGANPTVARVDLIVGQVRGPVHDRRSDRNDTAAVVARFSGKDWTRKEDVYTITTSLPRVDRPVYLRVRGTSTQDLEPPMDAEGENPWSDLWFYSNPIFIEVAVSAPPR
jgi:hypothetical protein